MLADFEAASCIIFRDGRNKIFPDAEVGGGINVICSQPEVADDIISGYNVDTFRDNHSANL